jgi:hypothetical protein
VKLIIGKKDGEDRKVDGKQTSIFQDIAAEDLLTYLIIKDNPKKEKVTKEFNWEQIIRTIKKTTSLEFIDNSLQELTEFSILKNGFNETPIDKKIYNLPKQIRIRKLQNMEMLNECIQRRNLIVEQKEKARKEVESNVKLITKRSKKQWNQMESAISKDIVKT